MRANKLRFAIRKFPPFESTIRKAWEAYKAESGCTLELDMVAMELPEFCKSTIGSDDGLRNGDWDIATLNTDWVAQVVHDEMIEDLTPYITKNPPIDYENAWSPAMCAMQHYDDMVLGLPFHNGPECMIYRKDLFESEQEQSAFLEQYGRPLKVPENWDELIDVAHFFQRPEENLYGVAIAAFPDGHNTVFDFCLHLWTRGGNLMDENGGININTKSAAEGLSFYRQLIQDKDAVHPACAELDSVRLGDVFARGEAAISFNWFGFSSMCEVVDYSVVKGKIGVANIPAGSDGLPVSLNAYWLYTIPKGSQHKDIAYEFILFLTRPEQDKMLTLEGGIGCRLSTWNDEEVNKIVPYYKRLAAIHQYSRTLPRKIYWCQIETIIDDVVTAAMNSTKPVEQILADGQAKVETLLKQYGD